MIIEHGLSDLTEAEHEVLVALASMGPVPCAALAKSFGVDTGAGVLAAAGRLIRCGSVVALERKGEALPRLSITPEGRRELEVYW